MRCFITGRKRGKKERRGSSKGFGTATFCRRPPLTLVLQSRRGFGLGRT